MGKDKDVARVLREAQRADRADPIVMYVGGRIGREQFWCRVCGAREEGVVPLRLSQLKESGIQHNRECPGCNQPCLRPGGKT